MLNSFIKRGQLLFLLSFAALILAGSLLLMLPGACRVPISFLDALFSATTAVCVTGLTVIPVHEFTFFGQVLILLLIQLGGLGVMTLSVSVMLGLGRHLSMGNQFMLNALNDDFSLQGTENIVRLIIKHTFWCEAAGAVLIFSGCLFSGRPLLNALWESVFLAISGYCNAGLSPYPDSMASTHWLSQLGSAGTIITGSLGIYVIYDLLQKYSGIRRKLRLHTKVVLLSTGMMLLLGSAIFLISGTGGQKANAPLLITAFYTTVSSGSAGFSTVDILKLPDVGIACCMVLMLVGGAPGSTAGGVKISTIFLVLAAIWSTIKGDRDVVVSAERSLPKM